MNFTFLEMNSFALVDGKPYPLDMRGELDDIVAFKNLKKIILDSEVVNIAGVHSSDKETNSAVGIADVAAPDIDWDISIESSQIDWISEP